ncbi:Vacuolar protein sorting-associated protein VTA1 like protein [Termitomyces sp. J132]|nr:Vacuolar protein sorting-associated protein VTA1 like protein [Termitomyces sp. J132]
MAYWCAYYAAQLGISLKAKDSASRDVLFALLSFLERLKKEIGPSDALDIETVSTAYVENFAYKVFDMADNEDRSGSATRGTAKKFLAAAYFLQVLKTFPKVDISETVEEKIKYAKWKATDIFKAFREGRKPTPGPARSNLSEEATPSTSSPPHKKDIPIGSWSTAATPGTVQGPPEHWEEPVSPTRGAYTQKSRTPKRTPWVSEELEGKDESEYLGLSVDTAKGLTDADDNLNETLTEFRESISAELSESWGSVSAPSSPAYEEQTYAHVAEQQPNGAMDEHAINRRSHLTCSPTQPTDLNTLPPGFVPNLHAVPTNAVNSSHAEHVSAPSIEAHPESHHNLYSPLSLSQHLPPIAVELTPSIVAKVQKHCRFAISSLDYEDAEQARKELRAALAILNDT